MITHLTVATSGVIFSVKKSSIRIENSVRIKVITAVLMKI